MAVEPASTVSGVLGGEHSRISGVSQVIVGPSTTRDRPAGERGVREQLVADGVDVLRLLEVGGGRLHLPLAGAELRRLVRDREERDPADRVVRDGADQGLAVADHERVRIDARAEVEHAQGDRRPARRDAAGQQPEQRRLDVVDPGLEDVGAAERPAGEEIAARVDCDVVRLRAREDRARGADVERVVDRQVVDVHGQAGVALDVVLVRRAEEPRDGRASRASRRSPRRRRSRPARRAGSGTASRRRPRSRARRCSWAPARRRRRGTCRPRRARRRGACRPAGSAAAGRPAPTRGPGRVTRIA